MKWTYFHGMVMIAMGFVFSSFSKVPYTYVGWFIFLIGFALTVSELKRLDAKDGLTAQEKRT